MISYFRFRTEVYACLALACPIQFIPGETQYLPVLAGEIESNWPTVPVRSVFAAQVHQETCISLKNKKCWSPTAELKTAREYGFGLGQLTVTDRFDNFQVARKLDTSLKDWTWENRYNAQYQLRTLVLMNKFNFNKIGDTPDDMERLAFSFAAYNGGLGGLISDRSACRATMGCDATRWRYNVEYTSKKSKVKYQGYGKSFFEINREYVANIMGARRTRYLNYFGESDGCSPIKF